MAIYQHCTSVAYWKKGYSRNYSKYILHDASRLMDHQDHNMDVLATKLIFDITRESKHILRTAMVYKASIGLTYEEFCIAFENEPTN